MFCPHCGAENPNTARHCKGCGTVLNAQPTPPVRQTPPAGFKDYMTLNIVFTALNLLCCSTSWFFSGILSIPLHIAAIVMCILGLVFSGQAKGAYNSGDYALAATKAKPAKTMLIITVILDVLLLIFQLVGAVFLLLSAGTGAFVAIAEEMGMFCIALR